MVTSVKVDERVKDVAFDDDSIAVSLMDGRVISVPLVWFPRLLRATREEREAWEVCGGGYGLHWEAIDEDLSTAGMLRGATVPGVSEH
ncbi:MAG: DUF2442 domain-containing protein [Coleofasciculaceae cyanobacterium RL_1_1]|nr:DUF2442 domain-containing protein [Coleofasciculaceae cyanobacterium RL_1_1]